MSVNPEWLVRGNFLDLAVPTPPVMQDVRDELCKRLGLPSKKLRIESYPPGPTLKHCYWWREGRAHFEEAQFFAEVSRNHAVLSLGLSIEKGREKPGGSTKAVRDKTPMKRAEWDWSRFVERVSRVVTTDLPAAAGNPPVPVHLRIRSRRDVRGATKGWEVVTFSWIAGQWFRRHHGPITHNAICEYVQKLDKRKDVWVIVQAARDFFPSEVKGMTAAKVAEVLMTFDPVRLRVRRKERQASSSRTASNTII